MDGSGTDDLDADTFRNLTSIWLAHDALPPTQPILLRYCRYEPAQFTDGCDQVCALHSVQYYDVLQGVDETRHLGAAQVGCTSTAG